MDFTFLKANGEVAFVRNDAEQAEWTQEEMSVLATFPTISGKMISRGMLLLFQDPATNTWQAFEIRTSKYVEGDHYQQITAESIAISELTDCHIREDIELTNVTPKSALTTLLENTGWKVGSVGVSEKSSGDVMRGSVWNAIRTITQNWNCYIEPRVTMDSNGITNRYLDILSTEGTWRGVRLSINKNISDAVVTYDDSELYTALYGYGGSYTEGEGEDSEQKDLVFDDVVWSKTTDHPAKPRGQGYIEDPAKTALYGRNGKPRFGYYQNTDINDANVLLQKTWESLKQCYEPRINISGTATDLYRLGYHDEPLRLHDIAIVEIEPINVQVYKQIVRLTVNLLDPTGNTPEIGDYIPNIIYINRDTEDFATGGSRGRGGGTAAKKKQDGFKTSIDDNGRNIHLNAQHIAENGDILQQAGMFIDPVTGVLIYAEDNENNIGSLFHVQSDRITAEVNARTDADNSMSSRIQQTADAITLEVSQRKSGDQALSSRIDIQADRISLVVEGSGANAHIKPASIVAAINNGESSIKISADHIILDGEAVADSLDSQTISCAGIDCSSGTISAFECDNNFNYSGSSFVFKDYGVSWKSYTARYCTLSPSRHFLYANSAGSTTPITTQTGNIVSSYTDTTIHYLGR